MWPTFLLYW